MTVVWRLNKGLKMNKTRELTKIVGNEDWSTIDLVDEFLFIFDHLPPRMKIIVDLKMTNMGNDEIAMALKIEEKTVYETLRRAKKRFYKP